MGSFLSLILFSVISVSIMTLMSIYIFCPENEISKKVKVIFWFILLIYIPIIWLFLKEIDTQIKNRENEAIANILKENSKTNPDSLFLDIKNEINTLYNICENWFDNKYSSFSQSDAKSQLKFDIIRKIRSYERDNILKWITSNPWITSFSLFISGLPTNTCFGIKNLYAKINL